MNYSRKRENYLIQTYKLTTLKHINSRSMSVSHFVVLLNQWYLDPVLSSKLEVSYRWRSLICERVGRKFSNRITLTQNG